MWLYQKCVLLKKKKERKTLGKKMGERSKILIIGGTGYIGKFIVEASAKSGHPTFALIRETTLSDPAKTNLIQSFKDSGVAILKV